MANRKGATKVGGRKKGTPNRRKTEEEERKRIEAENAKRAIEVAKAEDKSRGPLNAVRKKLAKELIEDYMMAFHAQAARFQPLPPGMDPAEAARRGFTPNEAKFMEWGKLTVDTARALAEFQSPKLRAHLVTMPGSEGEQKTIDQHGNNVIPLNDAVAAARTYARIMRTVEG
jgi:hypothetical protein